MELESWSQRRNTKLPLRYHRYEGDWTREPRNYPLNLKKSHLSHLPAHHAISMSIYPHASALFGQKSLCFSAFELGTTAAPHVAIFGISYVMLIESPHISPDCLAYSSKEGGMPTNAF